MKTGLLVHLSKKNTNEVWAFGSNEIELNHKENEETVEGLTIHYLGG